MGNSIEQKQTLTMQEIANTLSHDYYDLLAALCDNVDNQNNKLLSREIYAEYVRHSKNLIDEVRGFVNERRSVYMPYVLELEEKKASGHNCGTCSGQCSVQHNLKLTELSISHRKIYDIANSVLATLASKTMEEEDISKLTLLRNEATRLRNKLSQLIEHEELFLIPKIKEAQKVINAHN